MNDHLEEKKITIPSGELLTISFGNGKKNLVMIQGISAVDLEGTGSQLASQYDLFAKDYRVTFFDRRAVVKEGLTNWDLAQDIYDGMEALNIPSADVVGISQGGMIAMALTLTHPEKVKKLVLGVTASRPNEHIQSIVQRWVDCALRKDFEASNRETFQLMYTPEFLKKNETIFETLIREIKPKDENRLAIFSQAVADFDCYDRLNEIHCPVLVLGGKKDQLTTGQASEDIAKKLNCEIYMYPEYGHGAYMEAEDFNQRIYDFLQK